MVSDPKLRDRALAGLRRSRLFGFAGFCVLFAAYVVESFVLKSGRSGWAGFGTLLLLLLCLNADLVIKIVLAAPKKR